MKNSAGGKNSAGEKNRKNRAEKKNRKNSAGEKNRITSMKIILKHEWQENSWKGEIKLQSEREGAG